MRKSGWFSILLLPIFVMLVSSPNRVEAAPPNIVILFADDAGYGDLGCYGARGFRTPSLDELAAKGVRFTDFYVAQAVCSASRAALLTGCYPNRIGIQGALGPGSKVGISRQEVTLGDLLRNRGYATAAIGKWHLGHHPPFLPTRHGFAQYFGLPYSNDMWPNHPDAKPGTYPPLPLFENETVVETSVSPASQSTLTRRYTEHAVAFVKQSRSQPFFLYVAYQSPHVPLFPHPEFIGRSQQGVYGDIMEEIDWSAGKVMQAIREIGAEQNTLVIFASDNGPWLSYGNHAGSAGPLREGKGTAWEGGVRVPFVARFPGVIPAGAVQKEPAMSIDLLPTIAKIVGAPLPSQRIDGKDIGSLLRCEPNAKSPQEAYYFYFDANELRAVRAGDWKLIFPHSYRTMAGQTPGKDGKPGSYKIVATNLALYNLRDDIAESIDLAGKHPEVVNRLLQFGESIRQDLGDRLTNRIGVGARPVGRFP